jgi:hypothetical protein
MTLAAIDRLVHHATAPEMNVESDRRRAAIPKAWSRSAQRAKIKKVPDCRAATINTQRPSKAATTKSLPNSIIDTIMTSLCCRLHILNAATILVQIVAQAAEQSMIRQQNSGRLR